MDSPGTAPGQTPDVVPKHQPWMTDPFAAAGSLHEYPPIGCCLPKPFGLSHTQNRPGPLLLHSHHGTVGVQCPWPSVVRVGPGGLGVLELAFTVRQVFKPKS